MNTEEAIEILLAELYASDQANRPSLKKAQEARAYVTSSFEAWDAFAEVYEAVTDKEPGNWKLLESWFGCQWVERQLERYAALDETQLAVANPQLAAHLKRCLECAEMFATMAAEAGSFIDGMERAFEKIKVRDEELVAAAPPQPGRLEWQRHESNGVTIFSLAESLRYGIVGRINQFLSYSCGMVPTLADAVRGGTGDEALSGPAVRELTFKLPVDDVEVSVQIDEGTSADTVKFQISFSSKLNKICVTELLQDQLNTDEPVAGETTMGDVPLIFAGVPRRDYLLIFRLDPSTRVVCPLGCSK